jgi:hypothetical protein
MKKMFVALAAAGLLTGAFAAEFVAVKPGDMKSIKPIRVAGVKGSSNGRLVMTTGWINYTEVAGAQRVGNLLFDNYEGDGTQAPGNEFPTDGLYGEKYFFSELGETEGTRWIRRSASYRNVLWSRGMESLFSGGNGQEAVGVDVLFNQNVDEPFLYALLTSDDPTTSTLPDFSTFSGIIYDFGPVPPGFYLSNIDLRDTGLSHTMPSDGRGSYMGIFGNAFDEGTGEITLSQQAQPGLWGTKPLNPSQINRFMWQDGKDDDGSHNGDFESNEYIDWKFINRANNLERPAISYTVTRGQEIGSNDPAKLAAVDGNFVRVQQRFQFAPTLANAEIVYAATIPSDRDLTLTRTLRAYVTARANSLPFGDPSCRYEIALRNWNTGQFVRQLNTKPTLSFTEVYSFNIDKPISAEFIRSGDRRVEVRVSVFHLAPLSPAWELGVDAANVFYAYSGPIPLGPSVAFSKP